MKNSCQSYLIKLIEGEDLEQEEARILMNSIMEGEVTDAQLGGLITALAIKGEAVSEIVGFAQAMRYKAAAITSKHRNLIDTCGTGGDGSSTFNISTACALVVASAGIPVAKHGNRSVSSKCGSADVLEELGVNINMKPHQVASCIDEIGIGFLFAPTFHPAMKHAAVPRKELGFRSIFNLLGPLTNPLQANFQMLGVFNQEKTETLAKVLAGLGIKRATVVSGYDGLDEVSIGGPTKITELYNGDIHSYIFNPEEVGIKRAAIEQLKGSTSKENAAIILDILNGKTGPKRDIVLLNSAFALMTGNVAKDVTEGLRMAKEAIDSGASLKVLRQLIDYSRREVA
ncbi:MAG: anthranilate phosphoribosyltransferase [Bacillota bacterium]|nr:anthranilate phosphoribosyltransferase [Bacillota bacterium]